MKKILLGVLIISFFVFSGVFIFRKYRSNNDLVLPSLNSKNNILLPKATETDFQAHILRSEKFQRNIGNGLIFQLIPDEYGWSIEIVPESGGGDIPYGDFASIATPPYRGINALQIQGWHFRNTNNTAPNDGSVNAPQEIRDFQFVLNKTDAYTMSVAIEQFTSGKTLDFSPNVFVGQGHLEIMNLELGNLTPGVQAWIESIDVKVHIDFLNKKWK